MLFVLAMGFLFTGVTAEPSNRSTLSGRIVTRDGTPPAQAYVRIISEDGRGSAVTAMSSRGAFRFADMQQESCFTLQVIDPAVGTSHTRFLPATIDLRTTKERSLSLRDIWVLDYEDADAAQQADALNRAIDRFGEPQSDEDRRILEGMKEAHSTATGHERLELLVPCFFQGSFYEDWGAVNAASASGRVSITAIVNPNSGPDESQVDRYTDDRVLPAAHASGVQLIGYIVCSNSKDERGWILHPSEHLNSKVDMWIQSFNKPDHPISGFFLDNFPSDVRQIENLRALRQHIAEKLPGAVVFANPGTKCAPELLSPDIADAVIVHEGTFTKATIESNLEASRDSEVSLGVLLHHSSTDWPTIARLRNSSRIRYFYSDDHASTVEWLALASNWWSQVDEIMAGDRRRRVGMDIDGGE